MTSQSYLRLGSAFWALTAILALLPSWPYIYYRLSPRTSDYLASTIASTTSPRDTVTPSLSSTPSPSTSNHDLPSYPTTQPLPPLNPSLPKENGLIIDKIGVMGQIHEGENWQSILKTGIWRVPSFGTPTTIYDLPNYPTTQPIIIAAHRWGYLDWSASFRKLNSFYSLPKLAVDDTIKIIWEQREYEYKVYSVQSGTEIPEYNADLILYTCQLWNSPVRFFVLANRVID